jgi:hypothetical protein
LHLQWVKVFLIHKHVSQCLLVILDLLEFDKKHIGQFVEILLHVIHGHPSSQLEQNSVHSPIESALYFTYLGIVFLVCLCVLV